MKRLLTLSALLLMLCGGVAHAQTAEGNPGDAACVNPGTLGSSPACSMIALWKLFINTLNAGSGTAGSPSTVVSTVQGPTSGGTPVPVSASALPLPSNAAQETGGNLATLAGAVSASVVQQNVKQVNGITILTGAGAVGTGSQRVAVGQDTTTIAGSAPGTAGTPSANVVSVQGVASGTVIPGNLSQVAGVALGAMANYGTSPGAVKVQGVNASVTASVLPTGASTSANQPTNAAQASTTSGQTGNLDLGAVTTSAPSYTTGQTDPFSLDTAGNLRVNVTTSVLPIGAASSTNQTNVQGTVAAGTAPTDGVATLGRAENAEPTPATNGQTMAPALDLVGKTITSPYANKENMLRGTATATGTGATTLIAAQGAGIKIYVTGVQCYRDDAGTAAMYVTLDDTEGTGSGTEIVLPNSGGGGGSNAQFATPLVIAANTAFTFTSSASTTTVRCNAQGYAGS